MGTGGVLAAAEVEMPSADTLQAMHSVSSG